MTAPDPWTAWWWALVPEKSGEVLRPFTRRYLLLLTESAIAGKRISRQEAQDTLDIARHDVDYWLTPNFGLSFRPARDRVRAAIAAWLMRCKGVSIETALLHIGASVRRPRWPLLVREAPAVAPPVEALGPHGAPARRVVQSSEPIAPGSPTLSLRLSCGHTAHRRTRSGTPPGWVFCEEITCAGAPSDDIGRKPVRRATPRVVRADGLSRFVP